MYFEMLFLALFFLLTVWQSVVCGLHYDTFTGLPLKEEKYQEHVQNNTTLYCTLEIEACDPNDWRSIDGTCNNLKYPSRGASFTPMQRILPANFHNGTEPRKSKCGKDLPLYRKVRTGTLSSGHVPSSVFTSLITVFWTFVTLDTISPDDILNYMIAKRPCCSKEGLKENKKCLQIEIPEDDPVHRFSGIRCQNQTIPLSYQTTGCIKNFTTPARVDINTPLIDLSILYGNSLKDLNDKGRLFVGGLLKVDESSEKVWPPKLHGRNPLCFANQEPHETRCHDAPNKSANGLLNTNLCTIWFWRQHNRLAKQLAELNPCWDDQKLFYTARDINLALYLKIFYREMLPALMGRENMIRDGIITGDVGYRDIYDENEVPQHCLECLLALRYGHKIQNGILRLYDHDGSFMKSFPIVNLTCRPGFLDVDNHIDHITLGLFREPCASFDQVVDPDMAERALTNQLMSDVFTNDLVKNRYHGIQPYVKYLEYCRGKKYTRFEDLIDVIDKAKIRQVQNIYQQVEDIDLITGIWIEKLIHGGHVPSTLYCLAGYLYKKNIRTDRHWPERQNRPHAFTLAQLQEIEKATMAKLLCDVGDSVTRIQPHAFLLPGPGNEIDDCKRTTQAIDMSVFKDPSCRTPKRLNYESIDCTTIEQD